MSEVTSNPLKDPHRKKSRTDHSGENDASKKPQETGAALQKLKKAIEFEELSSRAYKKLISEAILIIEGLRDANFDPAPKASNENTEIAKIL